MMRIALVVSSSSPYFLPDSSQILAIAPANRSVSYALDSPLIMQTVRSKPMPVSTFFCLSGSNLPSAVRLNSINTLFQISTHLPQSSAGEQSGPQGSLPVSMKISVSLPQGPVGPAYHQLLALGR